MSGNYCKGSLHIYYTNYINVLQEHFRKKIFFHLILLEIKFIQENQEGIPLRHILLFNTATVIQNITKKIFKFYIQTNGRVNLHKIDVRNFVGGGGDIARHFVRDVHN